MQAAGTAERDHEAPDTEVAEKARAEENSRQLFVGGVRAHALLQGVATLRVRLRMPPGTAQAGTGAFRSR